MIPIISIPFYTIHTDITKITDSILYFVHLEYSCTCPLVAHSGSGSLDPVADLFCFFLHRDTHVFLLYSTHSRQVVTVLPVGIYVSKPEPDLDLCKQMWTLWSLLRPCCLRCSEIFNVVKGEGILHWGCMGRRPHWQEWHWQWPTIQKFQDIIEVMYGRIEYTWNLWRGTGE